MEVRGTEGNKEREGSGSEAKMRREEAMEVRENEGWGSEWK